MRRLIARIPFPEHYSTADKIAFTLLCVVFVPGFVIAMVGFAWHMLIALVPLVLVAVVYFGVTGLVRAFKSWFKDNNPRPSEQPEQPRIII